MGLITYLTLKKTQEICLFIVLNNMFALKYFRHVVSVMDRLLFATPFFVCEHVESS